MYEYGLHQTFFFFNIIWNEQSEYKVFYKLIGWL